MSDKPELHPWRDTGFTTDDMKDAAQALRDNLPKIVTGVRGTQDQVMRNAITALCIAADHIERMSQASDPLITHIQPVRTSEDGHAVYGLCSAGKLWFYMCDPETGKDLGWSPMPSGRANVVRVTNDGNVYKIETKKDPG